MQCCLSFSDPLLANFGDSVGESIAFNATFASRFTFIVIVVATIFFGLTCLASTWFLHWLQKSNYVMDHSINNVMDYLINNVMTHWTNDVKDHSITYVMDHSINSNESFNESRNRSFNQLRNESFNKVRNERVSQSKSKYF